jgi:hypothetical protein
MLALMALVGGYAFFAYVEMQNGGSTGNFAFAIIGLVVLAVGFLGGTDIKK